MRKEPIKKYRSSNKKYQTISLTMTEKTFHLLEKKVNKTKDKNMSKFIEETVFMAEIIDVPKRRKKIIYPLKKTFTFSEEFVKKIKKSNNMSLYIEKILNKKLK